MSNYKNKFNKWWKGFSKDDFLVSDGEYLYGEGIDNTYNGYGATIGPKSYNFLTLSSGDYITFMYFYDGATTDRFIYATKNGKIGYVSNGILEEEYTYTGKNILTGALIGGWVYFIINESGDKDLIRIDTSSIQGGIVPGNIEIITTDVPVSDYPSLYIDGGLLFIGASESVIVINNAASNETFDPTPGVGYGGPTIDRFNNLVSTYVYGISRTDTNYKLYDYTDGLVFWDGASTNNNGSVKLGITRGNVYTYNNSDFIIDARGNLYTLDGYKLSVISPTKKGLFNIDNSYKFKFNRLALNQITLSVDDIYLASNDTQPGIYKYGELYTGIGKGFSKIITRINGENLTNVYGVWYSPNTNRLYYSYSTATTQGIAYAVLDGEREDEGFIITPILNGNNPYKKGIREISGVAKNVGGLVFYTRKDTETTWNEIYSLPADTGEFKIGADEIQTDDFNDVYIKIKIINKGDGTIPYLNQFLCLFDITKE